MTATYTQFLIKTQWSLLSTKLNMRTLQHTKEIKKILENTLKTCTPLSWKIIKDKDKFLYLSTLPKIIQDYTDNFNRPVAKEAINTMTKIFLFSSINFFFTKAV